MSPEQTELINNHIRFVHHIVKRFVSSGVPKDEIVSAGYLGLVKAARTYDTNKKIRFTTYAGTCITNSILDLIDDHIKRRSRLVSLDVAIIDNREGRAMSLRDMYDDGERIEDKILQKAEIRERRLVIGLYLLGKSSRYAQIIRLRLRNLTHDAIATKIGISKSYISRILTKIEKELKEFKLELDQLEGDYRKRYTTDEILRAQILLFDPDEWIIDVRDIDD